MSNQRVQSKNLFNFRPQGYVDEDIVAFYEKMKTDFNIDMVEWADSLKDQSESEYVAGMRGMMDGMMVTSPFGTDPAIVEVGKGSRQEGDIGSSGARILQSFRASCSHLAPRQL